MAPDGFESANSHVLKEPMEGTTGEGPAGDSEELRTILNP